MQSMTDEGHIGRMKGLSPPQPTSRRNRIQHRLPLAQNLTVPEPQHTVPLRHKPSIARLIVQRIRVLRSIRFDNQPMFDAEKIHDIRADWHLPAELHILKPLVTQQLPKLPLRLSHIGAQSTRTAER